MAGVVLGSPHPLRQPSASAPSSPALVTKVGALRSKPGLDQSSEFEPVPVFHTALGRVCQGTSPSI